MPHRSQDADSRYSRELERVGVRPAVGTVGFDEGDRDPLYDEQAAELEAKLLGWGFPTHDRKLIMALYADRLTEVEVTKRLNYVESRTMRRHRDRVLDHLRVIYTNLTKKAKDEV